MRIRELIGPPHDLQAEQNVIGSMLLSPAACDECVLALKADDFFDQRNGLLFGHVLATHERGLPIDETILMARLRKAGELREGDDDRPGGVQTLHIVDVIHSVPSAANAVHYAEIVREKSIQRALLDSARQTADDVHGHDDDVADLLARAEQRVLAIGERRSKETAVHIGELMADALAEIDRRSKSHSPAGLRTGLYNLDAVIGGLREGELVILAARPSMGKTALATGIADHLSVNAAVPVLFVSLEMGRLAIGERMLAARAGVSLSSMRHGSLVESESKALVQVSAEIGQGELVIDDAGEQTISSIGATARRMKRRRGLSLLVIDYLQLIVPDDGRENRESQVAKMSRRLKHLARELSIPVLCLAQLNRDAEKRTDHKPKLSDLRESGAIEQDADIVMFVHRKSYYEQGSDDGKAEIIVSKHRNGPIGSALVKWESKFARFSNDVEEWNPDAF